MLSLLEQATESGTIRDLDLTWAQARREEKRSWLAESNRPLLPVAPATGREVANRPTR